MSSRPATTKQTWESLGHDRSLASSETVSGLWWTGVNMMRKDASMTDMERQLGSQLRQLVVEQVGEEPTARAQLATGLGLPVESVDKMLGRERWDLGLAMASAEALGMRVHVTHR